MDEQKPTEEKNLTEEQKDFNSALISLGLDSNELDKKQTVAISKDKNMTEKVTRVNNIALSYKMVLEGKTYSEDDTGFKQSGIALAGKNFINLSYSVLNSFSEEANLITTKDMDKFNIQFVDAFQKINNFLLRDRSVGERDARIVVKLFKDKLMNIGDIITGSQGNMEKVFAGYDDVYSDKGNPLAKGL